MHSVFYQERPKHRESGTSMDSNAKKRKYERLHCHHCNREVSKSTWYKHYEKCFDSVSGKWRTEEISCTSQQLQRPDFNFDRESSDDSRELERESDDAFSFPEDRDEAACNVSH